MKDSMEEPESIDKGTVRLMCQSRQGRGVAGKPYIRNAMATWSPSDPGKAHPRDGRGGPWLGARAK
jgi:hypothetical protein